MPRPAIATIDAVAAAVAAIEAEGGRATVQAVRDRLGGGSLTTILHHLAAGAAARADDHQAATGDHDPDPAAVPAVQDPALAALHAAVAAVVQRWPEYAADRAAEAARVERAAAAAAADEHRAALAAAEALAADLRSDLEHVAGVADAATAEVERLTAETARLAAELAEVRAGAERIQAERAALQAERDWLRGVVGDRLAVAVPSPAAEVEAPAAARRGKRGA